MKLLATIALFSALVTHAHAELGTPRIIGGSTVEGSQWPFVAMIVHKNGNNQNFPLHKQQPFCAGTLITPEWVVTAAHCFRAISPGEANIDKENIQVVLGVTNWRYKEAHDKAVDVVEMIVHPDFPRPEVTQIFHDIALVRLATPSSTTPVAIDTCDNAENTQADILGWGVVDQRNPASAADDIQATTLQHAKLPIANFPKCRVAYNNTLDSNHHLCAGAPVGGIDSCVGDSGGPLLIEHNNQFSIDGILSFGPALCGAPKSPGVYTNIETYLPWIESSIGASVTRNSDCSITVFDTDGDQVPDTVETAQGSDAQDIKSFFDTDSDGVPDYVERLQKTNINSAESFLDSDNDGESDYAELLKELAGGTASGGGQGSGGGGGAVTLCFATFLLGLRRWRRSARRT